MTKLEVVGYVVAWGCCLWAAYWWWQYRQKVPSSTFLLEGGLFRRDYPNGTVVYFVQGVPLNGIESLFLRKDLRELEKRHPGVFDFPEQYINIQGEIVPDSEELRHDLKAFQIRYESAYKKYSGRPQKEKGLLENAPFAYRQTWYIRKVETHEVLLKNNLEMSL
jgi:hypothetical protein